VAHIVLNRTSIQNRKLSLHPSPSTLHSRSVSEEVGEALGRVTVMMVNNVCRSRTCSRLLACPTIDNITIIDRDTLTRRPGDASSSERSEDVISLFDGFDGSDFGRELPRIYVEDFHEALVQSVSHNTCGCLQSCGTVDESRTLRATC